MLQTDEAPVFGQQGERINESLSVSEPCFSAEFAGNMWYQAQSGFISV